jgi:hypothetical protein
MNLGLLHFSSNFERVVEVKKPILIFGARLSFLFGFQGINLENKPEILEIQPDFC